MKKTSFNSGWQFRQKVNPFDEGAGAGARYQDVVVPHDGLITQPRDPNGRGANAYFPDVTLQYRKSFEVPHDSGDSRYVLEFEGVYRDAMVYVNGAFAGHRPSGYSGFTVDTTPYLRPGEANEVLVEARVHDDSRWYTGAGIYRDVWLLEGGLVHFAPNGVHTTVVDFDSELTVAEVATELATISPRILTASVELEFAGPDGAVVATTTAPVTIVPGEITIARQKVYLQRPLLWSAEDPNLYTVTARLRHGERPVDEVAIPFGVRRLQLDPQNGLRVNGKTVLLRGACVHHDNGILGAATFAEADARRVRLLKEAGFNCIRSAHNPLSRAMLDACDRLGMYVMDEAFDMWTSTKSGSDYALDFPEWWKADVEAMVVKDRVHPSVIMYSIGNEIPETGHPAGAVMGRKLAEEVRRLDPTRYVTNGINGMLAVMDDLRQLTEQLGPQAAMEAAGINTMMANTGGDYFNLIGNSQLVTDRTAESFGVLDVAGMNYLDSRYEGDSERFPGRIIVGTETFPMRIDKNWAVVQDLSHVIGDFTWSGWDYLGEVGIGRAIAATDDRPTADLSAPFPWIAAWCGDIDLIGHRRPASFYREIVFGLRKSPYIAVVRPGGATAAQLTSAWAWSDSISSWTWPEADADELIVEVYSDADEVELLLDGRSFGRRPAGPSSRFRAEFPVPYRPGELIAIGYRSGVAAERFELRTASEDTRLTLTAAETVTAGSGVALVEIDVVDASSTIVTSATSPVEITVDGPGKLLALGTADPAPTELYASSTVAPFHGRALAVVLVTGQGEVTVKAASAGLPDARIAIIGV